MGTSGSKSKCIQFRLKTLEVGHAPGSQPPFSLNPNPDQNMVVVLFIFIAAYCIYNHLTRPTQFCTLLDQNFEKNAQDPARIPEPWIQDPKRFLLIFAHRR